MSETETVIYGASDDLIEVEGNVHEELYAEYGEPTYVRVGDWKFRVEYDTNGEWKIDVQDYPSGVTWTHLGVGEADEYKDYSEAVLFDCPSGVNVEKVER